MLGAASLTCAQYLLPIMLASAEVGSPPAMMAAQLRAESGCKPNAVSSAGAVGLGQFMPGTAADMARQYPQLRPPMPRDPQWSIRANGYYMRDLYSRMTAFDTCNRWAKGLASYNQGERWTRRAEALSTLPQFWFGGLEFINPGKSEPNFRETQEYVRRILLRFEPQYVLAWRVRGACN